MARQKIGQQTKIVLTDEQRHWLERQPEAMAVVIRGLINQAMQKDLVRK